MPAAGQARRRVSGHEVRGMRTGTGAAAHAIELLGGRVERTADYQIPGTEVTHRLVIIKKVAQTPKKYPRAFAKIKKNPL